MASIRKQCFMHVINNSGPSVTVCSMYAYPLTIYKLKGKKILGVDYHSMFFSGGMIAPKLQN